MIETPAESRGRYERPGLRDLHVCGLVRQIHLYWKYIHEDVNRATVVDIFQWSTRRSVAAERAQSEGSALIMEISYHRMSIRISEWDDDQLPTNDVHPLLPAWDPPPFATELKFVPFIFQSYRTAIHLTVDKRVIQGAYACKVGYRVLDNERIVYEEGPGAFQVDGGRDLERLRAQGCEAVLMSEYNPAWKPRVPKWNPEWDEEEVIAEGGVCALSCSLSGVEELSTIVLVWVLCCRVGGSS